MSDKEKVVLTPEEMFSVIENHWGHGTPYIGKNIGIANTREGMVAVKCRACDSDWVVSDKHGVNMIIADLALNICELASPALQRMAHCNHFSFVISGDSGEFYMGAVWEGQELVYRNEDDRLKSLDRFTRAFKELLYPLHIFGPLAHGRVEIPWPGAYKLAKWFQSQDGLRDAMKAVSRNRPLLECFGYENYGTVDRRMAESYDGADDSENES